MEEAAQEFSLADTFNAFAKRAVKDFPVLEGKFAIYNVPDNALYGSFNKSKRGRLQEIGQAYIKEFKPRNAGALALPPSEHGKGYYLIDYIGDPLSSASFILEHELGHLIAPGGLPDNMHTRNFNECVADTFACLRQSTDIKRMQEQIKDRMLTCSIEAIQYGHISHFQFPVLQELERLSNEYAPSMKKLTPIQTANLSYRLTLLYSTPQKDLNKLRKIFKPVMRALDNPEFSELDVMKEQTNIMFGDHGALSQMIYKVSRILTLDYLDKKEWAQKNMTPFFTKKLQARMERKDAALQKETELPKQRLEREILDMVALGRFDKDPERLIDPARYESKKNLVYLQRAVDAYKKLRLKQPSLNQDEAVALARRKAEKRPSSNPRTSTPRKGSF